MRVRLHPSAKRELNEAAERYESHAGRDVAANFVTAYAEAVALILDRPAIGKPGPHGTRRISLHRFPFSLLYRIDSEYIQILAVAHWRRRPNYWHRRV
jgi:toxin ParE1/3/4